MTFPFARISELQRFDGQTATVRGWVTHLRSSGKVAFVVVRDGSGILQCVLVKNAVPPETWSRFAELTQETSVAVTGAVRADARAPGGYELGVSEL
ncbi:MAG TPA: OB-fold nucleic acid binding domain-containing protein, partial [Gemmatimonadaceae bacterium]|nr:OB-fold nucleic acid binding domain-containing protein [Gemmatimonadaceae bacterium]